MLYSIKNIEGLEKLEELASLKNQAEEIRLQDKLGKQKFHENRRKVFAPLTDTIENTFESITKTITETSINKNKGMEKLNDKHLEILNDRGLIASYFCLVYLKSLILEIQAILTNKIS